MISYLLWAGAALHPSVARDTPSELGAEQPFTRRRLALLAAASITGLVVRTVQDARGKPVDVPVVVGATVAMFLLVLVRMAGLMRALSRTLSRNERAMAREQVLRRAGEALVATADRDGIYNVALASSLATRLSKRPPSSATASNDPSFATAS